MRLPKKLLLATSVASVFILLLAFTIAGAQPKMDALVTISADQSAYTAAQEALVHVTISNPTRHTIKVLKWYTPVEGVEEPLFAINRDGTGVSYMGAIYKRPAPTGQDYISLKSGESITSDVPLSQYYDLSTSGSYSVMYDTASWNLTSEKGGGKDQSIESLTSNVLVLYIEGRQVTPAWSLEAPDAVTGATTFNKCTTAQQALLNTARADASNYAANAKSYLVANTQTGRYTTWFGIYNSSRYNTVTSNFTKIGSAMDTATVNFDCGCKKRYYAYVYSNQPYKIYLCSVYWQAPATGTDSKAGTLIHEMSHFTVVAGTNDYAYGQTNAKNLAISNPAQAIANADNHEYFAENTPFQN